MRFWLAAFAVVLAAGAATFYWNPYWIPSGSMKPTLLVGDYLNVRPLTDTPEQGDVLVFEHPVTGQDFIMRLIGLPGDRVQMMDGRVIINDAPVLITPDGLFTEMMKQQGALGSIPQCTSAVRVGDVCEKHMQIETLPNGRSYHILNIGLRAADNTGVYTVPEGHYFFLGDNRDNSNDSRFAQDRGGPGFVPVENVHGRAGRVIFSSAGRSLVGVWNWRSDRYFVKVE